jgi:hypothetical protein
MMRAIYGDFVCNSVHNIAFLMGIDVWFGDDALLLLKIKGQISPSLVIGLNLTITMSQKRGDEE